MKRKIIQISQCQDSDGDMDVLALCEDGSLWNGFYNDRKGEWFWKPVDIKAIELTSVESPVSSKTTFSDH